MRPRPERAPPDRAAARGALPPAAAAGARRAPSRAWTQPISPRRLPGVAGEEYREASLRIWEEMAAGWEGHRGTVWDASRAVGEWLVEALDPQPGETLLELAA